MACICTKKCKLYFIWKWPSNIGLSFGMACRFQELDSRKKARPLAFANKGKGDSEKIREELARIQEEVMEKAACRPLRKQGGRGDTPVLSTSPVKSL